MLTFQKYFAIARNKGGGGAAALSARPQNPPMIAIPIVRQRPAKLPEVFN